MGAVFYVFADPLVIEGNKKTPIVPPAVFKGACLHIICSLLW